MINKKDLKNVKLARTIFRDARDEVARLVDRFEYLEDYEKINTLKRCLYIIEYGEADTLIKYNSYIAIDIKNLKKSLNKALEKINITNLKKALESAENMVISIKQIIDQLKKEPTEKRPIEKRPIEKIDIEPTEKIEKIDIEPTEKRPIEKIEKINILEDIFNTRTKLTKKEKAIIKLKNMISQYIENGGSKEPYKGLDIQELSLKGLNRAIKDLHDLNKRTIDIKFTF